jgi:hypothetical protein
MPKEEKIHSYDLISEKLAHFIKVLFFIYLLLNISIKKK